MYYYVVNLPFLRKKSHKSMRNYTIISLRIESIGYKVDLALRKKIANLHRASYLIIYINNK